MAQAQAVVISKQVEEAALRAVFVLQYNTAAAVNFVRGEVPQTSYDLAVAAINKVARPAKKYKFADAVPAK